MIGCNELVALLTPWSVDRNWIWTEMAAAWVQRKRYAGITYGVTLEQIGKDHGGAAILSSTNVIGLNEIDRYLAELIARVKEGPNA